MKKYRILFDEIYSQGNLHRIQALKNFDDVHKGDIGGFIENESNLSQKGNCWIYDDAIVKNKAKVMKNAKIYNNAKIYGFAEVSNNVIISNNAEIFETAKIYNDVQIRNNVKVYGEAIIKDF